MPALSAAYTPSPATPDIKLVQHTESGPQHAAVRRPARKEATEKKPGLFRRLFEKLAGESTEPVRPVGEPAPPIPSPPPIVYNTQQKSGLVSNDGSIRARATGYEKRQDETVVPYLSGNSKQQDVQYYPSDGTRDASQVSHRQPVVESDGFINPFRSQSMTPEDEALLDLDSLIEDGAPVTKTAQRPELLVEPATLPDVQVPRGIKNADINSAEAIRRTNDGPYTGYQLDSNEQLYGNTNASPLLDTPVPEETVPEETVTPLIESAGRLSSVSKGNQVLAAQSDLEEIPLLDEPVTQIPAEVTPQLDDEIPLLEEEGNSGTSNDTAESLVAAPTQEVATQQLIATPEQVTEIAEEEMSPTDSEKLRSLEVKAQRDHQIYRIMARTGQKGFKGFCPVELRDNRQLVDSRQQYKAKFGLQTYHFSSQEAKSAFEANPAKYAPAAGGSDVVLLVNTGEEEAGTLDFTLWYRDRLYMFRSRETVAAFSKDPLRYANQY